MRASLILAMAASAGFALAACDNHSSGVQRARSEASQAGHEATRAVAHAGDAVEALARDAGNQAQGAADRASDAAHNVTHADNQSTTTERTTTRTTHHRARG
jgi:hypothetical protein